MVIFSYRDLFPISRTYLKKKSKISKNEQKGFQNKVTWATYSRSYLQKTLFENFDLYENIRNLIIFIQKLGQK